MRKTTHAMYAKTVLDELHRQRRELLLGQLLLGFLDRCDSATVSIAGGPQTSGSMDRLLKRTERLSREAINWSLN